MSDDAIRESFLRFPGWTQNFWTWVTGKALPQQQPLFRHTWLSYLTVILLTFFAGLTLSGTALAFRTSQWWLMLLAGWILSLSAARYMILVIAHQCIHKQFSGRPRVDKFVGELVTVLNLYEDANTFKVEHFDAHHRQAIFATLDDPPVQSLLKLGFRPGMSKRQLWWRAIVVFFSPGFYLQGFISRLKCNLTAGKWRRVGFSIWAGFLLSIPFWVPNGWQVLIIGFGVPVILLSQLSALLDRLGEHAWLTAPAPEHGRHHYHVSASWARFCGCAVPAASLPIWRQAVAWPKWLLAMLLYHLPSRLLVIVGDLPNHDFHHRYPATPDWMIAAYARQHDVDRGCEGGPPYAEIWGMWSAVDRMFESLSRAQASKSHHSSESPRATSSDTEESEYAHSS